MTCKWCLINGNFISLYNSRLCHSIHLLWMDMLICLMCLSIIAEFLLVHDIHYQPFFNTANVFSHSPINNVNLLISGFSTSVFINASSIPQNFPTTNSTVLSNSMAAEHGINLTSLCPVWILIIALRHISRVPAINYSLGIPIKLPIDNNSTHHAFHSVKERGYHLQ